MKRYVLGGAEYWFDESDVPEGAVEVKQAKKAPKKSDKKAPKKADK